MCRVISGLPFPLGITPLVTLPCRVQLAELYHELLLEHFLGVFEQVRFVIPPAMSHALDVFHAVFGIMRSSTGSSTIADHYNFITTSPSPMYMQKSTVTSSLNHGTDFSPAVTGSPRRKW